ncbi:High-affinity cGMP-specific 3',5'-cyclic phosphodiesterase, putative [Perkinsus marinus ATCC 50983]|uniref:High-affinity cGMP-specific 3',5'-cyclic phosphodiesterase, putative n=1 Tax=Perkinsus marinus (strain ATCC 50983 / TXsc) TaxID=423536 RepID=C5LW71_PERM5|nr:High-affinity cGMP-specific 3',5'-cyclic phosphodiesterase, putative [Perkinsus marinus ATCC 50983]EEQ99008.1 High-affinity cGMP-specific 3',5'-cyclic phosphodiesterase, putative [Perkinsus marinus ATCC 50983]|eukprot:XP_002766291.1 High-affinity cGMP-specific 3',5'-cyclic phosphodiesterase, putative [Perkinsus marinus ATCC 50983]
MDVLGTAEGTLAHHALSVLDLWGFFNDQDLSVGVVAIDMIRMQGFISDLFHRYHSDNPYHNFKHAYSVMSAAGSLMRYGGADEFCSPLEQLALLIAAVSHDVGHNGVNNDYYVKKVHPLAIRYNDQAVLESMHSALTFELILTEKNNFLADWQEEAFADFRKTTIAAILATDMKVHFDLTTQMQDLRSALEVDTSCPDTKMLVHKCLVHAADISNAVLPTDMYEAWAYRVSTEFYRQSLREKSEGIPTAPFMDSSPDDRAEFAVLQLGFMNFVVVPLWNAMADMWPALEPRRKQLAENVEYFKKLRESVKTEEDCPAE